MANVPISAFTVPANTVGIGATGYSLTGSASASFMDLAGTWNTTGTPTLIKANVTDTASNAASLLMDLQVGGVSQFAVRKNGLVIVKANLLIQTDASVLAFGISSDVILTRDTSNTLAQRNGVNAQAFRLYGTYTDASNFERIVFGYNALGDNNYNVLTSASGTGLARGLNIGSGGSTSLNLATALTNRWSVTAAGNFVAFTDNLYDIGASGATRPRSVYAGTSITPGAGVVVASLPTPSTGMIARVTDATLPVIGATVAGGGAAYALVNYNGANWTVIGV